MFKTIIVPLDGYAFGEHALPLAVSIARRAEASIRLVHVMQPFVEMVPELTAYQGPIEAEYREEKDRYLKGMAERVREASGVPVSTILLEGEIPATLRETASDGKADLIVMTTHGRGPLARFWLGSVTDQMVRESPVPLLLVHPEREAPDLKADPVFTKMLLPLDGTPLAEQILPPATELARLMKASCTLLRVVHTDIPDTIATESRGAIVTQRVRMMVEQIETLQRNQQEAAAKYLDGVADRMRARGVPVEIKAILDEQPAAAILHELGKECDFVALETHGYSGLKRLWLGSVADKVIRGSHVPVLVQRPVH
jgi:nucleotide-binding universal stress UspA family protein